MKLPFLSTLFVLAVAGCSGSDPVADNSSGAALPEMNNTSPRDTSQAPPADAAPSAAEPKSAAAIPAAFHGRWGMAPGDCTSTMGDAKGLLTISAGELKFYESVGRPAKNVETTDDSFSADFAFTGEGMSWTRFQTLQLQDGKLVRTESSPMASYTYARCS